MLEIVAILLFVATLIACIAIGIPVVWALAAGYVIFFVYGLIKGLTVKKLLVLSGSGIMTSKNILIIFALIGMLTATWRISGTIPSIVCYSARLIHPSVVVLVTFLLNCMVSVLTGSSFASVATMGVISMTIATTMERIRYLPAVPLFPEFTSVIGVHRYRQVRVSSVR